MQKSRRRPTGLCKSRAAGRPDRRLLYRAGSWTQFQGEPVAAVVATSPALAADAAEKVRIDYEPLPVVIDAIASLRNETLLHEQIGTNQSWRSLFEWGEVDKAFAEADTIGKSIALNFTAFPARRWRPMVASSLGKPVAASICSAISSSPGSP